MRFMKQGFLAALVAISMHHSIAGVYDTGRQVKMEGVITEFRFANPHPYVMMEVKNQQWKLEMDNLSELDEVGVTKNTFKPGDRIVVSGNPASLKSQQILYVRRLERPADGFLYEQVGNSPRINFIPR